MRFRWATWVCLLPLLVYQAAVYLGLLLRPAHWVMIALSLSILGLWLLYGLGLWLWQRSRAEAEAG